MLLCLSVRRVNSPVFHLTIFILYRIVPAYFCRICFSFYVVLKFMAKHCQHTKVCFVQHAHAVKHVRFFCPLFFPMLPKPLWGIRQ